MADPKQSQAAAHGQPEQKPQEQQPQQAGGQAKPAGMPDWAKQLYTEERLIACAKGEMTLAELDGFSGPEMLQMAEIGYNVYEQGKYDQARIIFEGLAALDPKEVYYRTALGAVYLAQDKMDEALGEFDHALKLDPNDIATLVNRGEVYLRKGMLLEAAQDLHRAVSLDPEDKDPFVLRARLLAAAALDNLKSQGHKIPDAPEAPPAAAKAAPAEAKAAPAKPGAKPAAKPAPKAEPKPAKKK